MLSSTAESISIFQVIDIFPEDFFHRGIHNLFRNSFNATYFFHLWSNNWGVCRGFFDNAKHISSVLKQKGNSQNGGNKKTKQAKFSKKTTLLLHGM